MLNLSDNELDRLSREAASQHDPGDLLGPQSWERLELHLDKELGRAGPDATRGFRGIRRLPFQYAPVLILIVGVTWYFVKAKGRKTESSTSPPLTMIKTPQQQPGTSSDSSLKNPAYSDKSTSTLYPGADAPAGASSGTPTNPASQGLDRPSASPNTIASGSNRTASGLGNKSSEAGNTSSSANPSSGLAHPSTGSAHTASGLTHNASPDRASPGSNPASTDRTDAGSDRKSAGPANPSSGSNRTASGLGNKSSGPANTSSDANAPSSGLARNTNPGRTRHTLTTPNHNAPGLSNHVAGRYSGNGNNRLSGKGKDRTRTNSADDRPAPEPSGPERAFVQRPSFQRNHPRISDSALRAYVAPVDPGKKTGPSLHVNRSLAFGFQIAPDFTSVNALAGDRPGSSIGFTVDYQFLNGWHIGTGALFSRKNFTARSTDYHVPYYYYRQIGIKDVDFIKGTMNMLEIPLTIRYDFSVTGNTIFFASGGVSSYLFGKEHCNYYYDFFGRVTCRDFHYSNTPDGLFSSVNLSLGVETGISNSVSVLLAPYMKLPTSDVGFGKVRMNSVGINFAVRYAPVISRKRKY